MQGVDQLHGSQTMVNRSVLLRRQSQDMHFRLHLAPESGSLGLGSVCFSKHPGDSEAHSTLRVSGLVTVSKTEISPPTHTDIQSLANFRDLSSLKLFNWKNSSLQGYCEGHQMF